jgi:hypothetical protein
MTLDEELTAAESVVQAGRENATQHLERVVAAYRLNETTIDHYRKYLDTTTSVAQATLGSCRRIVSSSALPTEDVRQAVQGLISGLLDSMKAMYMAMDVVERLAPQADEHGPRVPTSQGESRAVRSCSFCGLGFSEGIVAGPTGNICASCTRLACAVLGIQLQQ